MEDKKIAQEPVDSNIKPKENQASDSKERPKVKKEEDKRVLVGMTGGMDSTVAAFLLKKQGYKPMGVTLVMMDPDKDGNDLDLLNGCQVKNLDKVQKICDTLEIPFYAVKAMAHFQDKVTDPLVASKISGGEFLPCFSCNKVKTSILLEKAKELKIDKIATGHYAKIHLNHETKKYQIFSSGDIVNDQSHLLSMLGQDVLSHLILPMGETRKSEVQKLADKLKFPLDERTHGGEMCFIKKEGLADFVIRKSDYTFIGEGPLLNYDNDSTMGEHSGVHQYRLGQNQIKASIPTANIDKNMEVVKIVMNHKQVFLAPPGVLRFKKILISDFSSNEVNEMTKPRKMFAKIVDKTERIPCFVFYRCNEQALVEFEEEVEYLIEQQEIVFFDKPVGVAKVICRGKVYYTGEMHLLNRAETVVDFLQDEDGVNILPKGREFGFGY